MSSAARLAREDPAALDPSEHERPDAVTVAHADEVRVVHHHEREPTFEAREHTFEGDLEVATVGAGFGRPLRSDELRDERRVGGGVEPAVGGEHPRQHPELLREHAGVREVAVVPEREPGVADLAVDGLGVAPGAGPGGGVAHVADGEVAVERHQVALVEDLRDEAHVLDHGDGLAVAHRDPGRLLTPVLERVQALVGGLRHRLSRRVDAEHPAGVPNPGIHYRSSIADGGAGGVSGAPPSTDWPSARGMAWRQASAASASATSKSAETRRSPAAIPMSVAGTPPAAAARQHVVDAVDGDRQHHARRRLREPGERREHIRVEHDLRAALAGDRHLRERDREPTVGAVVDAVDHALADQSHGPDRAARPRRRDRPRAACPHAGRGAWRARSRPAPRASSRARRCASRVAVPTAAAPRRARRSRRRDRPRVWGRCRGRATRCRSSRFRRPRGCTAPRTPRSFPR